MGQIHRRALYAITACLWMAIGHMAFTDTDEKIYHLFWLATLIVSLWSLALRLARPDRGVLAQARLNLIAAKAESAAEEKERCVVPDDPSFWVNTPPHGGRVI